MLPGFGTVWFNKVANANILSLRRVKEKHYVQYYQYEKKSSPVAYAQNPCLYKLGGGYNTMKHGNGT